VARARIAANSLNLLIESSLWFGLPAGAVRRRTCSAIWGQLPTRTQPESGRNMTNTVIL
jgi:hypothetical protein